ncbi:unnamed protein product [Trichobilharzia szidati]|nr:unnamed protein product [Trichobilharzia szidati]
MSGWKRQYECKRLASIPNLFSRALRLSKESQEKNLGPGRYDISREIPVKGASKTIGPINTREVRFPESKTNNNPGVGTYGVNGDPYIYKEQMEAKHKSPSSKGLLELGGDGSRSLPPVGCHLAPGTYEISGSIQDLLNKRVSTRGPYDLLTGPRNNESVSEYPEPGTYPISSFTSDLLKPEKRYAGKFRRLIDENRKTDKFYSSSMQNKIIASKLGPGYYNPKYPNEERNSFNNQAPSFLSSSSRDAYSLFSVRRTPVGPGRYNSDRYDQSRCISGAMCSFDSNSSARLSLKEARKIRERLRPINVQVCQKSKFSSTNPRTIPLIA